MKTISALDYLSRHAVTALKDTIADFDEAMDLLDKVYNEVFMRYDDLRENLDPLTRAMLCLLINRLRWAYKTTQHVRDILDRRVLYFMFTGDDTQSRK